MIEMEKTLYTATVIVESGRDGKAVSTDGNLNLDLRYPKEMGGNGGGTNSEQLFAAGFAAFFEGAMGIVLRKRSIRKVYRSFPMFRLVKMPATDL
ncbi:hypothetical protein PAENIP36_15340 [Paenibacillus sp. P36]